MKKGSITRFKLDPKKPPKSDWRAFDAMTEEERHQAALSDLDAPPATEAQLARARRVPTVRALRKKLNLTQEEFAARFHLPLGTIRDWEQGAHRPDKAAQVLLTVIAKDPDAVARALGKLTFTGLGITWCGGFSDCKSARPAHRRRIRTETRASPRRRAAC